jgi:hypothetical protein
MFRGCLGDVGELRGWRGRKIETKLRKIGLRQ